MSTVILLMAPSPPKPQINPSTISSLVLSNLSLTPSSLSNLLHSLSPSSFSPKLISSVLRELSNKPQSQLLFFHSLLILSFRFRNRQSLHHLLSLKIPHTPLTHHMLFERQISLGNPHLAIRHFLSIPHPSLPILNSLLDSLVKSRRVEKASSLLKTLSYRFTPDVITYNILADGFSKVKKISDALDIFKNMIQAGIEPNKNTYNIILNGFFKAGRIREAMDFFKQMKNRGRRDEICRPDVVTFTTVMHCLGIEGRIEDARKVFGEMSEEGCLPNVASYNALIMVICKKGCVGDAAEVFDEMVRKGYTPNCVSFNLVIRGFCHAGEMGKAMEFFKRMRREECGPNVQTFNVLIKGWLAEGEIEKGLELFRMMGVKGGCCLPNLDTFNVIISAMFVRKRPEDMVIAGEMVMDMVSRGFLPRRFMFNRILNGLLLTGNQGFAKELLRLQEKYKRLQQEIRL